MNLLDAKASNNLSNFVGSNFGQIIKGQVIKIIHTFELGKVKFYFLCQFCAFTFLKLF